MREVGLRNIYGVVTGQDERARKPIKSVSLALFPWYEFHRIWGSDASPELPCDGTPPARPCYFPSKHGLGRKRSICGWNTEVKLHCVWYSENIRALCSLKVPEYSLENCFHKPSELQHSDSPHSSDA